jgi:hypothetical protein
MKYDSLSLLTLQAYVIFIEDFIYFRFSGDFAEILTAPSVT